MKGGSGRKVEIMEAKKEEMRKGMTEEKKVRLVKTRVKDTTKRGGAVKFGKQERGGKESGTISKND